MPRLIKGESLIDDNWTWIEAKDAGLADLPAGNVIVPLALWLAERDTLLARGNACGVWLDSDEEAEALADDVSRLAVIGLHFPAFADGRNLSNAVLLRTRFDFTGELRALGDVARDQLSYMRRCGIDAFQIPAGRNPEHEVAGLTVMRDYYQGDVIEPRPLFRRAPRAEAG
ncbi:MAG: DUF934 domain-containing protein [Gammaproteobacteria bacterium]|nr:MAG: DUF934 domain-containing protein [Gammaproteobacteria bacterium]